MGGSASKRSAPTSSRFSRARSRTRRSTRSSSAWDRCSGSRGMRSKRRARRRRSTRTRPKSMRASSTHCSTEASRSRRRRSRSRSCRSPTRAATSTGSPKVCGSRSRAWRPSLGEQRGAKPMTVRRDPTQLMQIVFLALLSISAATVGWWMYDHVRYARSVEQRFASGDPAVAEDSEARVNRILWEGGFFFVVLIGGMAVLTRTLRHDAELRRRQQNFLAAVSHEFKSPLASIQLAAETLVLRSRDDDGKRLGRRILEDGERLLRMIDNLLDTTRLEEGRQRLTPQLTNLAAATATAIAAIADRAQASGVTVSRAVPEDLALNVDPVVVETGLRNLLDNALKSCVAAKSRSIRVEGARTGGGIVLAVSDDGLGFPPEDAVMIFEKFHRLGDELRRATPGTGLGLYIVKRLVELSGGTVRAESAGLGSGATVSMRWPEGAAA